MKNGNKTFVKITNQNIFDKIESIGRKLDLIYESNSKEHAQLSGKARLNFWIASTAIALFILLLGFFIKHLGG
jgi:hypothetical protein